MHARSRLLIAVAALAVVAASCGKTTTAGSSGTAQKININMADIKYDRSAISVKAGQPVKFAFHNTGKIDHEAVIGDTAFQDEHEKQVGNHAMAMNDANAITVKPGATGELTHTFAAGQTIIGCHQPSHYAAGMKITVTAT